MIKFIIILILLNLLVVNSQFNCLPDPVYSCNSHGICINNGTYGFECKCDNNWDNQNCPLDIQCCNQLEQVFLASFVEQQTIILIQKLV